MAHSIVGVHAAGGGDIKEHGRALVRTDPQEAGLLFEGRRGEEHVDRAGLGTGAEEGAADAQPRLVVQHGDVTSCHIQALQPPVREQQHAGPGAGRVGWRRLRAAEGTTARVEGVPGRAAATNIALGSEHKYIRLM